MSNWVLKSTASKFCRSSSYRSSVRGVRDPEGGLYREGTVPSGAESGRLSATPPVSPGASLGSSVSICTVCSTKTGDRGRDASSWVVGALARSATPGRGVEKVKFIFLSGTSKKGEEGRGSGGLKTSGSTFS